MQRSTRTTLLATLAAAGALGAPAAADAAYTGTGTELVGNNANDALVIDVEGGLYTHNRGPGEFNSKFDFDSTIAGDQTLASNAALTIRAGGGNDTVTGPTVDSGPLTVFGDDGNDVLTGGRSADTLNGGANDDRIIGFRGADTMNGDAGNDLLIWNNGDGTDTMNGGGGNDEIEVNGADGANDAFRIKAGNDAADATSVRFDRINFGLFGLNISASERMTVNGLAGNEDIQAEASVGTRILLTANGGNGDDTIVGTPGADLLTGGDGNDTLSGEAGDDRLVGDRGGDTMNGGDGDDTTVWNNGDGSDVMNGDAGVDRVEVNGSTTAGDVFTIAPNGARALFRRTNFGPFSLDIGTAEALDANGLGGDDTFTAEAGISTFLALDVDGGAGNDTITGAEGDDTLAGGSGDDTITPLGGADLADGGEGDDQLLGRDGAGDLLRCGPGNDSAQTDEPGVDVLTGCETIDALPAPLAPAAPAPVPAPAAPTPAPAPAQPQVPAADVPQAEKKKAAALKVSSVSTRKRKGRHILRVKLSCPAGAAGACEGTIRFTTAKTVSIGGVKVRVLLASKTFDIKAGTSKTVSVTLPKKAERFASRKTRKLSLAVGTTYTDADDLGAERTLKRTAKLKK